MMEEGYLRERLERIIKATKDAKATSGWWVKPRVTHLMPPWVWGTHEKRKNEKRGKTVEREYSTAEKDRVFDNLRAGSIHFAQAGVTASHGMEALDRGDHEYAELALRSAESLLATAMAMQLEPDDVKSLSGNAKRRGRRSTTADRNRRLAEAVAALKHEGHSEQAAIKIAIEGDAGLKMAFRNMSPSGIYKALQKGADLLIAGN